MKTFVLITLSVLPAALTAQVVLPSPTALPALTPPSISLVELESNLAEPVWRFSAESVPDPPSTEFKMRVVRPKADNIPRMPIARPDDRYDYKILTPAPVPEPAPPSAPPRRAR